MTITTETIAPTSSNQPRETILSEKEAADYLKSARVTLRRRRDSGELQFYRSGSRVLYSLENHIKPFLARCQERADKEADEE